MRKRIRLGEKEKEIIKTIALGLFTITSIAVPNLPLILKPFFTQKRPKQNFRLILKRLEQKNIIYLGGEKIKLTKKGQKLLKEIQLQEIILQKPTKWDGLWRLVSYDIPDIYKNERDWFRSTLIRLGFRKIQESLWVHPYECKEEIAIIAQNLSVSPYVIIMITDHLPNQTKIEKYFNLN
jgi:DNA-binding transcriptional regulator PaaX